MYHPFFLLFMPFDTDFIFERGLDWLNASWRSKPVPEIPNGIFDEEKYKKQQEYAKATDRFSMLSASVSIILTLVFFICSRI